MANTTRTRNIEKLLAQRNALDQAIEQAQWEEHGAVLSEEDIAAINMQNAERRLFGQFGESYG